MKTEMDVVIYMYFKDSPDYIDSKYIWVHGSNSLDSSVFAEVPLYTFLALHRKRKRCDQVRPIPCYSQSEVICIQSFRSVAKPSLGFFPKISLGMGEGGLNFMHV